MSNSLREVKLRMTSTQKHGADYEGYEHGFSIEATKSEKNIFGL